MEALPDDNNLTTIPSVTDDLDAMIEGWNLSVFVMKGESNRPQRGQRGVSAVSCYGVR